MTALTDVNLRLAKGEVLGLIGDNGAGKSTLLKILCGFQPPTSGRIVLEGEEVRLRSVDHARSLGIDAVYQDLALITQLTVFQNMFLNREKVSGPLLNSRAMRKEAQEHLDEIGVRIPDINAPVARLSGGQRQAIAVARSVFSNPKILLLDEPLAAMGVKEGSLILDLISQLKARGQRLDHHHRAQLRPARRGVRPGEHDPGRQDHPGQAQRRDVGRRADRHGGGRVPAGPGGAPRVGLLGRDADRVRSERGRDRPRPGLATWSSAG